MSAPSRTATPARLASVAAALALLATLAVGFLLEPAGVRAEGPLPACRYDDVLTTPRGYADWSVTLVDTILRVPKGYVPPDLVSTAKAGITGGGTVRAVLIDDLRAVTRAAAAAGSPIAIQSAYRSYAEQGALFADWVDRFGYDRALEVPARPGHSEHQLGTAIDFRADVDPADASGPWVSTPAARWMELQAWRYGFVMSYPKGETASTCYDFEPWHYRYVGRALAAKIHASGLTTREFLWAGFTSTILPMGDPPVAGLDAPTAPASPAIPGAATMPGPTPTTSARITPAPATPGATAAAPASAPAVSNQSPPAALAAAGLGGAILLMGIVLGVGRRRRLRPGSDERHVSAT
jgi:D-alanyl-D-alanine carboxypeptidase